MLSIWRYGALHWSPTAANEHVHALWRACARLLENSELGRPRDDIIAGLRSTHVAPHVVFYRVSENSIDIVRVMHERHDIDRIFD